MTWWLHWGFLVAEVFLPLLLCILPQLWIFQSFRIWSCTLLITWTKQRLCLSPAGSYCPSSPMHCLGWKFPSDLFALPSDTGVYSGCPVTAHLALGFATTFLLLGQQLSCQWSYVGLLKTQPSCGYNRWLIPISQVVACPLYLMIVTISRGNSEAKGSCFLLPLYLSAQTIPCCMNVMGFLTNNILKLFWFFNLFSWWFMIFPVANAMENQISTSPYS